MAENVDTAFTGSVPDVYDRLLVPLIFEPYAADIAARVAQAAPTRVLEIAAGTGVVTRHLARALPAGTDIVATDLQHPMLERAKSVGTARPVGWQQADAMALPFGDASFDAVVCQFGVMFFPDKAKAFAEARRVLQPGGVLVFNVWDAIAHNEFAEEVTSAVADLYPQHPPRFLARVPHGYFDARQVEADLRAGGFGEPGMVMLTHRSRADSALVPAAAYCQGTPLRGEIEVRDPQGLQAATAAAARAIERRFGRGPVDGKIQALVVTAR